MMKLKLLTAAILLSVSAPSFAADMYLRHHHRHHRHVARLTNPPIFDFYHNYGPADFYPGTTVPPDRVVLPLDSAPYGIYNGFDRHCGQSTATYRGQDGRPHPCN